MEDRKVNLEIDLAERFYIYGSMTDKSNRTECLSMADVMGKFKEVVRVYRQHGNTVTEGSDSKWTVVSSTGKTESLWIEDEQGRVIKTTGVG